MARVAGTILARSCTSIRQPGVCLSFRPLCAAGCQAKLVISESCALRGTDLEGSSEALALLLGSTTGSSPACFCFCFYRVHFVLFPVALAAGVRKCTTSCRAEALFWRIQRLRKEDRHCPGEDGILWMYSRSFVNPTRVGFKQ